MVLGKRTSVRGEPTLWRAIWVIAATERIEPADIVGWAAVQRSGQVGMAGTLRAFVISYLLTRSGLVGDEALHLDGGFEPGDR